LAALVSRRRGKPSAPPTTLVPVEIISAHDHVPATNSALVLEFPGALRIVIERNFDEATLRQE